MNKQTDFKTKTNKQTLKQKQLNKQTLKQKQMIKNYLKVLLAENSIRQHTDLDQDGRVGSVDGSQAGPVRGLHHHLVQPLRLVVELLVEVEDGRPVPRGHAKGVEHLGVLGPVQPVHDLAERAAVPVGGQQPGARKDALCVSIYALRHYCCA